jgi:hypothetical protein
MEHSFQLTNVLWPPPLAFLPVWVVLHNLSMWASVHLTRCQTANKQFSKYLSVVFPSWSVASIVPSSLRPKPVSFYSLCMNCHSPLSCLILLAICTISWTKLVAA